MGGGKNYVLLTAGVGFKSKEEGAKKRKLVRGNTITEEIYQVNAEEGRRTGTREVELAIPAKLIDSATFGLKSRNITPLLRN